MQEPKPGDKIWAARIADGVKDDETVQYTLGAPIGKEGGFGKVFTITPDKGTHHNPALVAKFFHADKIKKLHSDVAYARRMFALALSADDLNTNLPFCSWPRRLIFTEKRPKQAQTAVLGFTMARIPTLISLEDILLNHSVRAKLKPQDTIHILLLIADRLSRMHKHPYRFVFSDFSDRNVLVSYDFNQVYFIDPDAYCFHRNFDFPFSGTSEPYISPYSVSGKSGRDMLPPEHDHFTFAILVFRILMANLNRPVTSPFQKCGQKEQQDLVRERIFPLDRYPEYKRPTPVRETYARLPTDVRAAFTKTFTTETPVTVEEWISILSKHRRSL